MSFFKFSLLHDSFDSTREDLIFNPKIAPVAAIFFHLFTMFNWSMRRKSRVDKWSGCLWAFVMKIWYGMEIVTSIFNQLGMLSKNTNTIHTYFVDVSLMMRTRTRQAHKRSFYCCIGNLDAACTKVRSWWCFKSIRRSQEWQTQNHWLSKQLFNNGYLWDFALYCNAILIWRSNELTLQRMGSCCGTNMKLGNCFIRSIYG